jgi:hypothetical protein
MKRARVLTLDELLAIKDQAVWLQYKSAYTPDHYEMFPDCPLYGADNRVLFVSGRVQAKGLYGKQWRCWTLKPTEAEAKDWLPK